ncbi:hypothetical protein JCM6882_006837 [Rhodosporidiobolus microsporus]
MQDTLLALPDRYRHLARTDWDVEFLSKPEWVAWLDDQIRAAVPAPGQPLVDYVRIRVEQLKGEPQPQPQPQPQQAYSAPPPPSAAAAAAVAMNGSNGQDEFTDLLDLTSYAHDDSSTNGFGVDGFSTTSVASSSAPSAAAGAHPHHHLYGAAFSPSPSPIPSYAGAIAPFSQPAQAVYAGPITPFTPGGAAAAAHGQAQGYSSTLQLQGQLISEERQRSQQQQQHGVYLQPAAAQAFFDPRAFQQPQQQQYQQQQQQAAQTITPSVLTGAPVASTSSAKPKKVARAASPANSSSSSAPKRSRTASPPSSSSYDPSHWTSISSTLRPYLSSKRIQSSPLATAAFVLKRLGEMNQTDRGSTLSPWGDASDVPPEGRAEVLTALVKYAKDEFWDAWVEQGAGGGSGGKGKEKDKDAGAAKGRSDGVEVLQRWLEGAGRGFASSAAKEKDGKDVKEGKDAKDAKKERERERKRRELEQASLALVLQVLGKLPVSLDHLMAYPSVPKLVKRISDRASEGAVKAAATQVFGKWSKLQEKARAAQAKNGASTSSSSSASAKRKAEEKDGPAKKLKPTTDQTKKPTPTLPIAAKPVLPSFSKKKAPDAPTVAASPFAAAMSGLKKKDVPPPPPPPPPMTASQTAINAENAKRAAVANAAAQKEEQVAQERKEASVGKNGKKKKSVRWKPDEELVAVREIEKAIYEDDENSERSGARVFAEGEDAEANFRDMNLQEGQTLHMHLDLDVEMDEEIDYYEPVSVEIPDTEDFAMFRQEPVSREAALQAEREASAMAVDPTSTPPESPGEPPEYAPEQPDPPTATMQLAAALAADEAVMQTIEMAQAAAPPASVFAQNDTLSSLLGELASGGLAGTLASLQPLTPAVSGAAPPTPVVSEETRAALRNYRPEQVEAIIRSNPAQFGGLTLEQLGMAPSPAGMHGAPPPPAQHYPQGYPDQGAYNPAAPYGQPWQPPPSAPYVPPSQQAPSWPPQPNYAATAAHNPAAYNGYVPPANPGAAGPVQVETSRVHNAGWRNKVPCRFFKSPRGCDRGELCAFRHDA